MNLVNAKSLKVMAVLNAAEITKVPVPNGAPRVVLGIMAEGRMVSADIASKSLRRAQLAITEHGVEGVAVLMQGRLVGETIADAGLSAMPRTPKPEAKP